MRRRLAFLLQYDGTDFSGSQLQPGRRTVQGVVEAAFEELTGESRRVAFAGRTDAGVHALGQVAAVDASSSLSVSALRAALNHLLPADLAVRAVADVEAGFDPRRHAVARTYRYRIRHAGPRAPLSRGQEWQRAGRLDVEAMTRAAALLPRALRDWSAFAGKVPEGYPTVRTLRRCDVEAQGAEVVLVTMEANGFLPHQVRRTVGALVRVGSGGLHPEQFAALVDGAPGSAGPTAPPQGLVLCSVAYPPGMVSWGESEMAFVEGERETREYAPSEEGWE